MNAEYIESNLLNQLRLITVGHVFPVWVYKTCIFVKAGELNFLYQMTFEFWLNFEELLFCTV